MALSFIGLTVDGIDPIWLTLLGAIACINNSLPALLGGRLTYLGNPSEGKGKTVAAAWRKDEHHPACRQLYHLNRDPTES